MYRAVVALSNTETDVLFNTDIKLSSSVPVVQVTLVAGPPVEIQVRMESTDIDIPDIAISPGHIHSGMIFGAYLSFH